MKTKEFEDTVKIGDTIMIYDRHEYYIHALPENPTEYKFMGYSHCSGCDDPCPGHVVLQLPITGNTISGCYRSEDNIRLHIIIKKSILPEELFDI